MTWSYDVTKLQDATLGPQMQVRLMIGDTDTTDQQMQDEEIALFLDQEGSTELAAARSAEGLAAKYARQADINAVGILKSDLSKIAEAYSALAERLRSRANIFVAPFAGGISQSDKVSNDADVDRVAPSFWRNMEENPGTSNPTDSPFDPFQ